MLTYGGLLGTGPGMYTITTEWRPKFSIHVNCPKLSRPSAQIILRKGDSHDASSSPSPSSSDGISVCLLFWSGRPFQESKAACCRPTQQSRSYQGLMVLDHLFFGDHFPIFRSWFPGSKQLKDHNVLTGELIKYHSHNHCTMCTLDSRIPL